MLCRLPSLKTVINCFQLVTRNPLCKKSEAAPCEFYDSKYSYLRRIFALHYVRTEHTPCECAFFWSFFRGLPATAATAAAGPRSVESHSRLPSPAQASARNTSCFVDFRRRKQLSTVFSSSPVIRFLTILRGVLCFFTIPLVF